jgi:hypothetical protein
MELPLAGHPYLDDPDHPFQCDSGQTGPVWFLAAPFGTSERNCTVPAAKAIFFTLADAECSTLEADPFHGDTEAEQRACAHFWADHIVDLFCEVDGVAVTSLQNYRFDSPQFTFTAPTPWIFGDVGGTGTSVGDGYYIMLPPLSKGAHTLHYGGAFHFSVAEGDPFDGDFGGEATFHLTVQ